MKKNKIYKISKFNIIAGLFAHILLISVTITFSIILITILYSSDNFWCGVIISHSFLGFMLGFYGIFPVYLCWSYYQWDKNTIIFIDYEKSELQYIRKGKETQCIKFEDIAIIEEHRMYRIAFGYYKIILNNGNFIIVTSLIKDNIYKALPKTYSKTGRSNLFLPRK
jgi:hypothetical protein